MATWKSWLGKTSRMSSFPWKQPSHPAKLWDGSARMSRWKKVYIHVPIIYTHVPITYTHVPITYTHVPITYTHVPITYTHVPIIYTHVPIIYTHVPIIYTHVPIIYILIHVSVKGRYFYISPKGPFSYIVCTSFPIISIPLPLYVIPNINTFLLYL